MHFAVYSTDSCLSVVEILSSVFALDELRLAFSHYVRRGGVVTAGASKTLPTGLLITFEILAFFFFFLKLFQKLLLPWISMLLLQHQTLKATDVLYHTGSTILYIVNSIELNSS